MTYRNKPLAKHPVSRVAPGIFALLFSISASAAGLGEIMLHSTIAQPLRATVKVISTADEEIERACFAVEPAGDSGLPSLSPEQVTLKYDKARQQLTLTSRIPINDPILALTIRMDCGQALSREYTLMPDPPPSQSEAAPQFPAVTEMRESTGKPARKGRKKQRENKEGSSQPGAGSPIAALEVRGYDRVRLGPEPSELAPGELAVAPRSELGEMEDRLLKLETSLTSLNSEVDALGAALAISAEQTALSKKLRAAQASQASSMNIPANDDEPNRKSLANWLELLFSTLLGGALTSSLALWLSRRQSRLLQT